MKPLLIVIMLVLACCPAMAENAKIFASDSIKGKTADIKRT